MNKYIAKLNGRIVASGEFKDEASFSLEKNVHPECCIEVTNKSAANLFNKYLEIRDKVLDSQYDYLEDGSNIWIHPEVVASNKNTRDALRKARLSITNASFFAVNKLLSVDSAPIWCKPLIFRYADAYRRNGEQDRIIDEWVDFIDEWVKISK